MKALHDLTRTMHALDLVTENQEKTRVVYKKSLCFTYILTIFRFVKRRHEVSRFVAGNHDTGLRNNDRSTFSSRNQELSTPTLIMDGLH